MPRLKPTLFLIPFLLFGAHTVTAADNDPSNNDPYVWLEDVHGQKPLAWVADRTRNRGRC